MKIPGHVEYVLRKLKDKGFSAYLVGGAPRDFLLGLDPNDYDISTNAGPEELKEIFPEGDMEALEYGGIKVKVEDEVIEVTSFRKDISYTDGRRPDKVLYGVSLEEDLKRRDFQLNALAWDFASGEIIDLWGIKDRIAGQDLEVSMIGESEDRLTEDSLRIIRGLYLLARVEEAGKRAFFDKKLADSIRRKAFLLKNLAKERKGEELRKILKSRRVDRALKEMVELGIFRDIFGRESEREDFSGLKDLSEDFPLKLGIFMYLSGVRAEEIRTELRYDKKLINLANHLNRFFHIEVKDITVFKENLRMLENKNNIKMALKGLKILRKDREYLLLENILLNKEPIFLKDLAVKGTDITALFPEGTEEIGIILKKLLYLTYKEPEKNNKDVLVKKAVELWEDK